MTDAPLNWIETVGAHTVGSLWIPVLSWTVLAGAIYGLLRWRGTRHPLIGYHVLRGLFWSLPAGVLLAAAVDLSELWSGMAAVQQTVVVSAESTVVGTVTSSEGAGGGMPEWPIYHGAGVLTVLAGLTALGRLLWIGGQTIRLQFFRRRLDLSSPDQVLRQKLQAARRRLSLRSDVRLLVGTDDMVPMTFGMSSPVIVLPPAIVRDPDRLQMSLVHELAHIRRGDYLQQWMEELMGALVSIHPLTGWIRREIEMLREMVCDADVIQHLPYGRRAYASLLYDMTITGRREASAMALSEHKNNLQRRIEAMRDYSFESDGWWNAQRTGITLGGLLLVTAIAVVACSEMAGPESPAPAVNEADESSSQLVFVAVETMPELIGGLDGLTTEVQYPESARNAGKEGRVVVQFIVDENGNVTDPRVLKAPEDAPALEEEALRVVEQAQFEPGMQRGKAVPVKMSLPITFRLGGDAGARGTSSSNDESPEASPEAEGRRSASSSEGSSSTPVIREGPPGRISGTVTAQNGEPLPGANIVLVGTQTGSASNSEGEFTVRGVSPGTYNVRVSYVGYADMVIQGAEVNSNLTTTVNAELQEEAVGFEDVEATANE